jgi:O-antigen/teichoic acid export membrane protein
VKKLDKAMEMGRASATGSFHLFVGKIVSTVILAVGAIIIGWFILESEYGLYAVSLIPATTILLFQDWGVGSALIRKCAKYRASNNTGALRGIIVASLTFEIATGLVLTVFSLLIANFIASTIFSKPETAFLITLASFSILSAAITTVAQSVFIGFERLSLSSATLICQAVVYGTLAPLLVYMGYGAFGAVVGYTLSIVITSIISVALLFFVIFKNLGHATTSKYDLFRPIKGLLQ